MEQRLLWMFLALHKVESNNKKQCLLLIEVSQKTGLYSFGATQARNKSPCHSPQKCGIALRLGTNIRYARMFQMFLANQIRLPLGIQSYSQMIIGVSNHLRNV